MLARSHLSTLFVSVGLVFALARCGSSRETGFTSNDKPPADSLGFGDAGQVDSGPGVVNKCVVPADTDDAPNCTQTAAADAFAPVSKWAWSSTKTASSFVGSMTSPLVANLTDDNNDGKVDLCDVPDVIVTAGDSLVMLSGDKGTLEKTFDGSIIGWVNPALGDLDGDGVAEIVAQDATDHLVAYKASGKVLWTSDTPMTVAGDVGMPHGCTALAIYDLDGDGHPEIIAGYDVFSSTGKHLFSHTSAGTRWCSTTTAADLDGDGKLEVIFGSAAYHADGSKYWDIGGNGAQPQVANLDADSDPEILLTRQDGVLVLEHDGKVKFGPVAPEGLGSVGSMNCFTKPTAIHDFDGDGVADVSLSSCTGFGVYNVTATGLVKKWLTSGVQDSSGSASNTAFDFLGRGIAQAIYGDEQHLWVYDGKTGATAKNFPTSRVSRTIIEYPVVADVDNDGSADILVVSNDASSSTAPFKTIEVFEDAQKRWIPTRRIWNQHAYHVTNVREDGTIPTKMKKSWLALNTFRTNAQVSGGGDCKPPPPNPPK